MTLEMFLYALLYLYLVGLYTVFLVFIRDFAKFVHSHPWIADLKRQETVYVIIFCSVLWPIGLVWVQFLPDVKE